MYNEAILKLYKAGFNVYEIAQSLGIDIADVRVVLNRTNDSSSAHRDFKVLQQVLTDMKRSTSVINTIKAAAHAAHAATIECQSLELLQSRVRELSKLEPCEWTSKHTYELCAILKQLNSAINSEAASSHTDMRVVNVKFV